MKWLCQFLAGLILIVGAIMDLCLAFRFQMRTQRFRCPAIAALNRRAVDPKQAALVLVTTGFFACAAAWQFGSGIKSAMTPTGLLLSATVYALLGLMTVQACLIVSRRGVGELFGLDGAWRPACIKGVVYGLAAIPPVAGIAYGVTTGLNALGYEMEQQELFDWLSDPALSMTVKGVLIFFALVMAPMVEELLFRGILFPAMLKGRTFVVASVLSGLYFALVHVHAASFLPLLALSLFFSFGYAMTGSILTPMIMHVLFNFTGLLFFFSAQH